MRLGRADTEGAEADAEQALAHARRAKDPQALFPSTAVAAHVFMELGGRERALPPAEEFLAAVAGGRGWGVSKKCRWGTTLHLGEGRGGCRGRSWRRCRL